MTGVFRSVGAALFGVFAVPVAGFSGIAALVMLLVLITLPESRSLGAFLFFIASCGACYAAIKTLYSIAKRSRLLVEHINEKESLNLSPANLLGHPSPAFFAFDKVRRRLAICNSITSDYKIYDFQYVLQWYYDWGTGTSTCVRNGGAYIPGTVVREPVIEQTQYRKNFMLVVEVADETNPIFKFPMQGEAPAQRWCATLNSIFNG